MSQTFFFFYFNNIPTFKWIMSLLLFWLFISFACSWFMLPFGGHLSTCIQLPVGAFDCWLVRCCVLSIVAATRAVSDYLSLFFSLMPRADSVLYVRLTTAMRILCAFAENASHCIKWGPPWIVGPYAQRVGRGGAAPLPHPLPALHPVTRV